MKTELLLATLKDCRGAIENASVFPVFGHFCFCETYVYSFNDVCAVVAPLHSGINAALKADTLLGVLSTLGEEVELEQAENEVTLRSGKIKVSLASRSPEAFVFEPPDPQWALELEVTEELMQGLTLCSQTVGDDSQHREFSGVTFEARQGKLTLYSSDDVRVSRFNAGKTSVVGSWILPARGCGLLTTAWGSTKTKGPVTLCLGKEWVLLNTPELLVYSKVLPEHAPDFDTIIKRLLLPRAVWHEVPAALCAAVLRAEVLVNKDSTAGVCLALDKGQINVSLFEGNLSQEGTFEESITLKKADGNTALTLGIVKLNQSLAGMEELMFSPLCLGLRNGEYTCCIAPFGQE